MEEVELSYTAGGNVKWYSHFRTKFSSILKKLFSKRKESICPYKELYINIQSSFICNSQNLEPVQMYTTSWPDKQILVYPYNGLLLSNKKDWTIDIHNNVDNSQNTYAE